MTVAPCTPSSLERRLDQVVARIRGLRVLSGAGRVAAVAVVTLVALYASDRTLDLPRVVRALLLLVAVAVLARETWRHLLRPLLRGPDREDAARLVETANTSYEGRLITALEIGDGEPGSLERQVVDEAAAACEATDLREVLDPAPSLRELGRGAGLAALLAVLVFFVEPHVGVFAQRWALQDVAWPRQTHLTLDLAARGASHVVLDDGTVVAASGGALDVELTYKGTDPGRVELVIDGGPAGRRVAMTSQARETYRGYVTVQPGDTILFARGGDDDGDDPAARRELRVIDPPQLIDPAFTLTPPSYLGEPATTVGVDGLVVSEGTLITMQGTSLGDPTTAELRLASRGEKVDLEVDTSVTPAVISGSFLADESESLFVNVAGEYGLTAPDPSQYPLLVRRDRAPTLRSFSPVRSDVKVTARAVVPFGAVAEDDHGVDGVTLEDESGRVVELVADAARPNEFRWVLDLVEAPDTVPGNYRVEARDRRDLPGNRGPQITAVDGRRVHVVEDAEVQRLLADRQLRLKEAFSGVRERQQRALEATDSLIADPPGEDDPDLVAAVVAQNQVTTRAERETRELCAILDETISNRLDPGTGAEAVLQRRLEAWRNQAADVRFDPEAWQQLAADYEAGEFGRLDTLGRLLDMADVALSIVQGLSPAAHDALSEARRAPSVEALREARKAQLVVDDALVTLLDRMDEWEDYQEVLSLVQALIGDQAALRKRSQEALGRRSN